MNFGEIFGKEQMNFFETAVSFVFPRRCPVCDEIIQNGSYICEDCKKKVEYIAEPVCKKCGKTLENGGSEAGRPAAGKLMHNRPRADREQYEWQDDCQQEYCMDCTRHRHFFRQGKAVFAYQKGMKQSMYRFKYSNKREYADFYAKEAARLYAGWIRRCGAEVMIPIPMYAHKKRMRGYNQAEVFARRLGKELALPVESRLVKRIRNTTPQKELNDKQRKDNLKGAFQLSENIVKYSKILLVDDIYTTGSTMDAVAELLLAAGVKEVYFICICIGKGY